MAYSVSVSGAVLVLRIVPDSSTSRIEPEIKYSCQFLTLTRITLLINSEAKKYHGKKRFKEQINKLSKNQESFYARFYMFLTLFLA